MLGYRESVARIQRQQKTITTIYHYCLCTGLSSINTYSSTTQCQSIVLLMHSVDCAFIHEGNDTFVKENLVNFDKLRMFSLRIHTIEEMKKGTLDETIITATLRTPHIRKFIKTLPVVNNQTTLHLKSKSLE